MEIIQAKYSEVKQSILDLKKLTEETCSIKLSRIKLTDPYYQDYGVVEMDWDNFFGKYDSRFNSELIGLEYEKYFPEILPYETALQNIFFLIASVFSKKYYRKKLKINEKERLEVGDLVLSKISKKFVKRSEVILIVG